MKILKRIGLMVGLLVVATLLTGGVFMKFSAQFGGKHTKEDIVRFKKSKHFSEGKFHNLEHTRSTPELKDLPKLVKELSRDVNDLRPEEPIEVQSVNQNQIAQVSSYTRVLWFGHSGFMLEMDGKRFLIDPMLTEVPAPHPLLGGKRYFEDLPIAIENLPAVDAVIFSHDHYDHLDYETVVQIKDRVGKFYTPLGVGTHLRKWGVPQQDIVELDWWQETTFENLKLVATPARHFSGRGLSDNRKTLWASWVIQSPTESIFFSGDSGYGSHFKEIGNKYGPFDLAMMECGQYNDSLPEFAIHMFPEQTVQASLDVKAKKVLPVHWGAFTLNRHPWQEPIERLLAGAYQKHVNVITPQIGEFVNVQDSLSNYSQWWKAY